MPHQALQDLQRYTGIQHEHRIGMAERMWRDRDRERHTISISGGNRFPNRKRLARTVLIFTEKSDQLSRATDRVPGLPASPGYAQ